jgi:hypothetical protein
MKNPKDITPEEVQVLRLLVTKGYRKAEEELVGWSRGRLYQLRQDYETLYDEWRATFLKDPQAFLEASNPKALPREEWPRDLDALRALIPEPVHPAADELPLWPVEKLHAAAEQLEHIKRLADPIRRLKSTGEILDGRNRRILCVLAGVRPEFQDVELLPGMTAEDYVEETNILRRQLTCEQLAAHAALRYAKLRDQGKLRRAANLQRGRKAPEVEKIPSRGSSLQFLAQLFGVNVKYIQAACTMLEDKPELLRRLKDGKISMVEARRECGLIQPKTKKKAAGEGKPGSDGAKTMAAAGKSELAAVAGGADPNATERVRLLALARAVEEACRQVPASLKSKFKNLVGMARRAIQDFN